MEIFDAISPLRAAIAERKSPIFVPTMGNLHAGHLSLISRAKSYGDPVVVSIFVNPLQFAPNEDFAHYPRTFSADVKKLRALEVDIVFAPTASTLYPEPQDFRVLPGTFGDLLEGMYRPGFFSGVATVVLKLFTLVQPKIAIFGKKDFQQCLVIQNMVRQFALPIEIVTADTCRDSDGLALSSRNTYLSAEERQEAPVLYQTLQEAAQICRAARLQDAASTQDLLDLENSCLEKLRLRGWLPDYFSIRHAPSLEKFSSIKSFKEAPGIILAAATLGKTRLIDNVEL